MCVFEALRARTGTPQNTLSLLSLRNILISLPLTYSSKLLTQTLSVTAGDISDKGSSDQIKTVFQNDQGKKTIDVYWIADDGGKRDGSSFEFILRYHLN